MIVKIHVFIIQRIRVYPLWCPLVSMFIHVTLPTSHIAEWLICVLRITAYRVSVLVRSLLLSTTLISSKHHFPVINKWCCLETLRARKKTLIETNSLRKVLIGNISDNYLMSTPIVFLSISFCLYTLK